jgi:thioester reductase-like protein
VSASRFRAISLALPISFPGFIGRRLVERLLADEPRLRINALVEERMLGAATAAAAEMDAGRIELLAADIGAARLGLETAE